MRRIALILAVVAALPPAAPSALPPAGRDCGWPMFGRDPGRSFAQADACSEMSPANVASLVPAWILPTSDNVTASPTVAGGIAYVGSWEGTFRAIDVRTGAVLWTLAIEDPHDVAFGRIVSTAAVESIRVPGAGRVEVVLFGGGGTLYALAAGRTGPRVLAAVNVDPRDEALRAAQAADPPQIEIESSPVVGHFRDGDRIFVGMDVHNRAGVGRTGLLAFGLRRAGPGSAHPYRFELLYKYDPETGAVLRSLTEGSGRGFGCGGVWSSPALDAAALGGDGVIVFGTSNCDSPQESATAGEIGREAVIAIRARTGEELWRFQPREPNNLDDDFGSTPTLLPGGGVGIGGKDGWFYAFDLEPPAGCPAPPRCHPAERWRAHAGQSGRVNPGFAVGGFIGAPAVGRARHPLTGEERIAVFGVTALPTPFAHPPGEPGDRLDASLLEDPARLFSVHAIDAATGEILWRSPLGAPSYGHVSYADGVVFAPITFGMRVMAFEAGTGAPLWLTPTLGAPSSTPVVVGDTLLFGTGTRETDLEFKAFGDRLQDLASGPLGEHPLSRLSSVVAYRLPGRG